MLHFFCQRVEGLKEMVHPPSQDSQDLHAVQWIPWLGLGGVFVWNPVGNFTEIYPEPPPPKAGSRFATARITWTIHFLKTGLGWEERCLGDFGRCPQLTRTGHDMKGKTIHQLNRGWWIIRSYTFLLVVMWVIRVRACFCCPLFTNTLWFFLTWLAGFHGPCESTVDVSVEHGDISASHVTRGNVTYPTRKSSDFVTSITGGHPHHKDSRCFCLASRNPLASGWIIGSVGWNIWFFLGSEIRGFLLILTGSILGGSSHDSKWFS